MGVVFGSLGNPKPTTGNRKRKEEKNSGGTESGKKTCHLPKRPLLHLGGPECSLYASMSPFVHMVFLRVVIATPKGIGSDEEPWHGGEHEEGSTQFQDLFDR